jgi:hypothetical protein
MATPEITDAAPAPKVRSGKVLAWMIISQIIFILLIAAAAIIGIFFNLLGGWSLNYITVIFLAPVLLLIPMIASWVAYGKKNMKGAVTLTVIMAVFLCLDLLAVAGFFGYLVLINSGP